MAKVIPLGRYVNDERAQAIRAAQRLIVEALIQQNIDTEWAAAAAFGVAEKMIREHCPGDKLAIFDHYASQYRQFLESHEDVLAPAS